MPVSTRSQIFGAQDDQRMERSRLTTHLEDPLGHSILRNPHHGLKEKMKALTQFYEQRKQESAALNNASTNHPSAELISYHSKETKELRTRGELMENRLLKPTDQIEQVPSARAAVELLGTLIRKQEKTPEVEWGIMKEDRIKAAAPPRIGNAKNSDQEENEKSCYLDGHAGHFQKKETAVSTLKRKLFMGSLGAQTEGKCPGRGGDAKSGGDLMDQDPENISVSGGSRILVFVRLRPMAKKEKDAGSRCCVRILKSRDVYLTELATENDYLRLKRVRGRHFTFDASFPDSTSQQEVYAATTADLVEAVLQGRNGSVFCYGATGAGKTYTMLGTVENPGVMVLAIKELFSKIRQRSYDGNHEVHLSYLEVYNETVRDLLSPGRPLVLREDKQGIQAAGLTQYRASSADEVMALLQQGNMNRTTEPTRVNETSSRSHAILQVIAEYRVKVGTEVISRVGKLSLIDLAGSERAVATEQRTLRSIEGANINRSLLALSSCINALVESKKHIPFRNSKLTQLLKDSLGGACNTVMIANISPSNLSLGETQNTLHWADRAKEIRTKACPANEELVQMLEPETDQAKLVLKLQNENQELKMLLASHQHKLLTIEPHPLPANSSPNLSSLTKFSLLAMTDTKRKSDKVTIQELQDKIKAMEEDMRKIQKVYELQIMQKDDLIHELTQKINTRPPGVGMGTIVTRASLRRKEAVERTRTKGDKTAAIGELKSPSHQLLSSPPTVKKRSFWDITAANSPSALNLNVRKTKSHVVAEQAPSMLLQPGFARQRPD